MAVQTASSFPTILALAAALAIPFGCGGPNAGENAGGTAATAQAAGEPTAAGPPARTGPIDIASIGYDRGAADAPVLVIEFSDFGCPYCGRFALETYPALRREFIQTGKVRWKFVPFVMGMFPNGAEAARAAECAAEQGDDAFWAMHDLLYARQRAWKSRGRPGALFRDMAAQVGLDVMRFGSCYDEHRREDRTRTANLVAMGLGIHATPTFFVNGMLVRGALPAEQFRLVLRRSLGE